MTKTGNKKLILIAGKDVGAGSKVSYELHLWLEKQKIPFEVRHAFTLAEFFKEIELLEEGIDFDLIIQQEGTFSLFKLWKVVKKGPCHFAYFADSRKAVEGCLETIKKQLNWGGKLCQQS